jgi:outer membrane biosynthesis protein TonB
MSNGASKLAALAAAACVLGLSGARAAPAPPPPAAPDAAVRIRRALDAVTTADLQRHDARFHREVAPGPPGSTLTPPQPIVWVEPRQSVASELASETALLVIECVVDEEGSVCDCRVLHSWPAFEPVALGAVAQWRFRPALVDGVPRATLVTWIWRHEGSSEGREWKPHWKFRWDRAMVAYEW